MPELLLEASGLTFAYRGQSVLNGVDLRLESGEALGLAGVNGSGKTTLFRCLTGLERIASGRICLGGREIRTEKDFRLLRRMVGYSVQNAEDQLIFPAVIEDVSFGPLNLGLTESEAAARAKETLAMLGLNGFEDRLTHELSGGQQKLVALAAVLAMRPRILLLDEPFNALDSFASRRVAEVISRLDCAKIIVAHDFELLGSLCGRCLELRNGRLEAI